MPVEEKDFELEIFRQVNEHMRATDRKYWVTSGAHISLFVLFMSRITEGSLVLSTPDQDEVFNAFSSVVTHFFIAVFGMAVYLMQNWYRAWKEHYLEILHKLRGELYPDQNKNEYLPFWLQRNTPEQPVSVDNSLKLITMLLNTGFVILVSSEINHLFSGSLGVILAIICGVIYAVLLYMIKKTITKNKHLNA